MALFFGALVFASSTIFVQNPWPAMVFAAVVALLLAFEFLRAEIPGLWILAIPVWGVVQILAGTTIYPQSTIHATIHWLALAAVFLLARRYGGRTTVFLDWFVVFAGIEGVLCLAQLHTSQGRILWWIPSGYEDYVYGTFPSYNNFAQFAELALPVALVRAFQNRRQALWYILAAGFLFAAVIASTSRAGGILVLLELIGIPLVLLLGARPRQAGPNAGDIRQAGLLLVAIPLMAVIWTMAAGWDRLWERLQFHDPMAARKEFLLSAVDMAKDRPFAGHGLGTFVHAYPRFAQVDLPNYVNHAHNDWAEFAAEGGILFCLLLLLPLAAASRRMLAHPWSIGCAVVAVHAVVDFPFARPGVIGWYFALLGFLYATEKQGQRTAAVTAVPLRWIGAGAGFGGALAALWIGAANLYFLQDTPDALATATKLAPRDASYWLRHSQLTGDLHSLRKALDINPNDADILIESGLRAEIDGKLDRAVVLLTQAAAIDRTWLPRWTLANFYFRQSDEAEFWKWSKAAASTGAGRDFTALFRLALAMDRDRNSAAGKLLPDRPEVLREWISYLLRNSPQNSVAGLEKPAQRLVEAGSRMPDRNYAVAAVERFLAAKQPAPASRLWKAMVERNWLPGNVGQSFAAQPLGEGYDWRMSPAEGVVVSPHPGSLTVSFSGKQPEFWPALQRIAEVEPSRRYRLRVEYETEGVAAASGVRWRVLDEMNGHELARSAPLAATLKKEAILEFQAANPLVRIQLFCERERGYGRVNGAIHLSAAELTRIEGI
jgi:O-antigen ligase/tetratricopeptide (TPR) repeat protein